MALYSILPHAKNSSQFSEALGTERSSRSRCSEAVIAPVAHQETASASLACLKRSRQDTGFSVRTSRRTHPQAVRSDRCPQASAYTSYPGRRTHPQAAYVDHCCVAPPFTNWTGRRRRLQVACSDRYRKAPNLSNWTGQKNTPSGSVRRPL